MCAFPHPRKVDLGLGSGVHPQAGTVVPESTSIPALELCELWLPPGRGLDGDVESCASPEPRRSACLTLLVLTLSCGPY